jgi:hypothetical protein
MRFAIALLMAFGFIAGAAISEPGFIGDVASVVSAQEPSTPIDVTIDTDGDSAWWANPVWLGLGVVALLALIAIVVAASRGGTTVVKD